MPHAPCPMTPDASTEGTSARHWLPHAPFPSPQSPVRWRAGTRLHQSLV
ncbi:MAG: hypothetical protein KME31_07235 [Tolypothrix carrinoi HA7290-LM1]|nr:hypothetical protein [Tolypothrix carrinoi HA7290-LM1]